MKILKSISIVFIVILFLTFLYNGIPTGKKNIYVEIINSDIESGRVRGLEARNYYADAKLDTGEIIRLRSKDSALLSLNNGYIELDTYYSFIKFKTVYKLSDI